MALHMFVNSLQKMSIVLHFSFFSHELSNFFYEELTSVHLLILFFFKILQKN